MDFSLLEWIAFIAILLIVFSISIFVVADLHISMASRDSRHLARILLALRDEAGWISGPLLCPKMPVYIRYNALLHLENQGLVQAKFENAVPNVDGTPRRRVYQITDRGMVYLQKHYDPITGGLKDVSNTA